MRSLGLIPYIISWLRDLFCKPHETAHRIAVEDESGAEQGEGQMGKPLSNTSTRSLTLVPKGKSGKRDKIQPGTMRAVSVDPAVAAINLDPTDEFKATITPVDDAESPEAVFNFTADADLGEGVTEITGTYSCPIVSEQASVIDPVEGDDTPKV